MPVILRSLSPLLCKWEKAALQWNWCGCSAGSSENQILFREAATGAWDTAPTTGLQLATGEQLHHFKGIPPPSFSLPSGLDTGVRHAAPRLALWESQAERATGNKQSMRRHMGLSSRPTRGWSFAGSQVTFLRLQSQNNTCCKIFCAKREKPASHSQNISCIQQQNWSMHQGKHCIHTCNFGACC